MAQELTELQHYFAIRTDLAAAVAHGAREDIEHHLDELADMSKNTDSDRIRRACRKALSAHERRTVASRA